jgi:hypothetical protein
LTWTEFDELLLTSVRAAFLKKMTDFHGVNCRLEHGDHTVLIVFWLKGPGTPLRVANGLRDTDPTKALTTIDGTFTQDQRYDPGGITMLAIWHEKHSTPDQFAAFRNVVNAERVDVFHVFSL